MGTRGRFDSTFSGLEVAVPQRPSCSRPAQGYAPNYGEVHRFEPEGTVLDYARQGSASPNRPARIRCEDRVASGRRWSAWCNFPRSRPATTLMSCGCPLPREMQNDSQLG